MNQSTGFQLIFLGAPLGGSFRIPYVLFGKDAIIKKLSLIDIHHSKRELLEMFSQMQGLLSLIPISEDEHLYNFADPQIWKETAAAFGDDTWPVPADTLLKNFKQYRDETNEKTAGIDFSNAVYIAGKDKATPCGYRIENTDGVKELVF